MSKNRLEADLECFEAHWPGLVAHHENRFALVIAGELLGVFDTWDAAYASAISQRGRVPMLIRQVLRLELVAVVSERGSMLLHGKPL